VAPDKGEEAWKNALAPFQPARAGRRDANSGMLALADAARKP
jgi:hypothetical protein